MAAISSPGIGSGLDIGSLVSQLVAAEGQVQSNRLDTKEAKAQATLSAVGTLKGALADFQNSLASLKTSSTFSNRKATSQNTDFFTTSATGSAAIGNYNIEVVQLAQTNKVRSAGFADSDTVVGMGTLTIAAGMDSFAITIDSSNDTLAEIRDAINSASGNSFVNATIVNVDDGVGGTESRLLLSGTKVGAGNAITITVDDNDLNDTDASGLSQLATGNLVQMDAAQDAIIEIDSQTVTRSSNSISDAIDGVTIELVQAHQTLGDTTELSVAADTVGVSSAINTFVTSYNKMIGAFNQLSSYDATTGATGILFGDATLRSVQTQIRREFTSSVAGLTGDVRNLVQLGITTQEDGTLKIDSTKLNSAITDDLSDVTMLFSSSNGVATRLNSLIDSYIGSSSVLDSRSKSLNNQIEDISDQREALSRRLASLESRLLAQFSAMDALVSQLKSTSNYLTQQLANLPGAININKS
ncbi:MAG: flagellar hook-associated 2-like protein [Proteobacteria bacterium]|nr:MAG: flagellar hook-associated 2-like protein [Pseudomonadota bacterium]